MSMDKIAGIGATIHQALQRFGTTEKMPDGREVRTVNLYDAIRRMNIPTPKPRQEEG